MRANLAWGSVDRGILAGSALSKPVAVAVHLEDVDVVGQAVEKGAGQALGSEGFGPFVERQVAGNQGGAALVALRDQFEQQLGAGFAEWNEAQLVDDQQLAGGHLLLQAQEAALVAGLHQFVDQRGGGGEADGEALLTGGEPEPQGHMGLAGAARAEGDDVLAPIDPFAAGQFQHLHLVQAGDRLEVEAVETFGGGELRRLDAALDHPALAVDQLKFHQPGQELNMVQPFGGALARQFVVFPEEGWQLQRLEVVGKQELRGVSHAALPVTRHR